MVEHLTFNQVVVGSIPTRLTIMRPLRLARPRTPPFHGGDRGSNPLGDAKQITDISRLSIEKPVTIVTGFSMLVESIFIASYDGI